MEYIMKKFGLAGELKTIGLMHGKSFDADGIKIVPLYHPAAANLQTATSSRHSKRISRF